MGHTQTTQNNKSRSCALVRAKISFLLSGHGHGRVRVYARLGHIKRTMQEPELPLPYDQPSTSIARNYPPISISLSLSHIHIHTHTHTHTQTHTTLNFILKVL
jgi:hypothetical protein